MREKGFSLLELVLVLAIVAVLGAVAFDRYAEYQQQADETAQRGVEAALRTALTLQAAHIAQQEGASHLARLETQNPFELLGEKPVNYGGYLPADSASARPGYWYYDQALKRVVHLRRGRGNWFETGDVERWSYRVVVKFGAGGLDVVLLDSVIERSRQQ